MCSREIIIVLFNSRIDKQYIALQNELLPDPYSYGRNKGKVELDLSNYAAKFDLKGATGNDTSQFAEKVDLTKLISGIDKKKVLIS